MTQYDNLKEYADPLLYDAENHDFEPDGPFYLPLAQQIGGDTLEIGCGTGRITIPMAQHGIHMTGLDVMPQMLEQARRKTGDLPIQWVEGDARSFRLDRRFRFIFEPGAAFQHMLTRADQEAMLARVREHLEPEGRFLVSVLLPTPELMANEPNEHEWFSYSANGREIRVSGHWHYDPLTQIKTETAIRRWVDDGQEIVREAPLRLRYVFPQELEALLHYNGFDIVDSYGDMDFSPLTSESKYIIYLCGVRRTST